MAYGIAPLKWVTVTLSLETTALDTGDVAAATQVVTGAFNQVNGTGKLEAMVLIDQDDNKAALDFWFFDANVALGTEDSAPSITDGDALNVIAYKAVATNDYKDLGGVSVAYYSGMNMPVKAVANTSDLYVAAVVTGTPTYTAAGIKLRLGFSQNS